MCAWAACPTAGHNPHLLTTHTLPSLCPSDYFRAKKGIEEPEFIAAASAHACINKACEYFGVKLVFVPVTDDQR